MTKVHITGIGGLTGCGDTINQSLKAMFNTSESNDLCAPKVFSRMKLDWGKDVLAFEISDKAYEQAQQYDSYHMTSQLGLVAALQAIEDAGLSLEELKGKKVGVVMGTTIGCSFNSISFYQQYKSFNTSDGAEPSLEAVQRFMRSNPAEVIAEFTGTHGPAQVIVNACASGTDAIGVGANWIKTGLCDVVIAGGSDALSRGTLNGFNSLQVMSSKRCMPFDANREGLNLGEGAATLILESSESVNKRNGKSRALLSGYSTACDAHHLTAPHPEGRGLKQALSNIFKQQQTFDKEIELAFVNVHGTATKDNDKVEGLVMADTLPTIPFFSSKGATGHTLGAAGAIEAALCVLCLEEQKIPKTVGLETADPQIPASPVLENSTIHGNTALSTSLAFGGLASALAITI